MGGVRRGQRSAHLVCRDSVSRPGRPRGGQSLAALHPPCRLTRQQTARNAPLFENGVYVQAEIFEQDPEFRVHTLQGEFRFRASEVLWGQPRDFLGRRARVERIPLTWQVSDWIEEEDFPAITGSSDGGTAPA